MSLFKKFGSYRIYVRCVNCGYGSEVKVPKGTAVADYVSKGKCTCDNCGVVFYPEEYTTEHFERREKKGNFDVKAKPNKDYKPEEKKIPEFKW